MKKILSAAVAFGVFASTSLAPIAYADVAAGALPNLDHATNADITVGGNNMNVQIQGGQGGIGAIQWKDFNVGKDASVNYEFTAHNQTALNRVNAAGGLSQIYGRITASGCAGCGYDATGKVILINPNGVLFGDGANVNLNSFTVSTMDGVYDKNTNQLKLDRNGQTSKYGIVVLDGARIHGDKAVNFASDKVAIYNGSQISTNVAPNFNGGVDSFGKVKIVTADGVNFAYYNNGAVKNLNTIKGSADKMTVSLNGSIKSGNIDIRNYSTNNASEINLKGATLKAVKAVSGNDGNIWLTASNNAIIEDSNLTTENYSADAANRNGGNVQIIAGNKVSLGNSKINAVGNVDINSQNLDVVVDKTTVNSDKNVTIAAKRIASLQNASQVNAKNITVKATDRAQAVNSTLTAVEDINLVSDGSMAWTNKANLNAGKDINVSAKNGSLLLNDSLMYAKNNVNLTSKDTITSPKIDGTSFAADKDVNVTSTENSIILTSTNNFNPKQDLNLTAKKNVEINSENSLTTGKMNVNAGENVFLTSAKGDVTVTDKTKFVSAKKVFVKGANDVKTSGVVDMNNIQTNLIAGRNVNATLKNVGNRQNGLVAKAGNDMAITTDGTLSVSSLISGKDMTVNANKVIAGLPYTTEQKLPGDASERSYIEVGGEFTSNVTTDNYEITQSGDRTNDGQFNQRHHIQYGSDEKILLVNKRPVDNEVTDPNLPDINNGNDVDVINPGQKPVDPEPSNPDEGGDVNPNPNPNPDQGGDGQNPNPDQGGDGQNPNPDEGGDVPCPDVPDEDGLENENAPGLLSVNDLAKYSLSSKEQKKF